MLHFEQTIDCPAVYFDLFGVPAGQIGRASCRERV